MVVIVRAFPVSVEDLAQRSRLPSVEELRPKSCPLCQQLSRPPGDRLQIVGHGTYQRQALGLIGECRDLVVWIRRFLCRGCRRTISVLPDALYPRRWYAAVAILLSLVLALLRDQSAAKIRERFADAGESRGWKTLERWQRQLLCPLWSWMAQQLGFTEPSRDRPGCRSRLTRLLALHGATARSATSELAEVARCLVVETAHAGTAGWEMGRGPPAGVLSRESRRARR
jgi:hypothetical protein